MNFDEIKRVPFTPEQANTVIAALVTHLKRMKRRYQGIKMEIAEHLAKGERALALKKTSSNEARLQRIAETREELNRMRELFPEVTNGNSEN